MSDAFLADIVAARRPRIARPVAVVVAHPDDETLGCGALLPRVADLRIVHVTDGAPRDGADALRHGFPDSDTYAEARRRELTAAAAIAGHGPDRLACLGVPDQAVARAIAVVARELEPILGAVEIVLTHAVEGGHPDHDATAFAVWAAARLVERTTGRRPAIVEMPFYRAGPDGRTWIRQSFAESDGAVTLKLTDAERRTKSAMLAAHATQAETLASFGAADECYRVARPFGRAAVPPSPSLYDHLSWGISSGGVREQIVTACEALGLDPACP